MLQTTFGRLGWDPFAEMRRMQDEINRLFDSLESATATAGFPPINLWVGDDSVVVTAEVPGVAREDIDLRVQEDTLTIQGQRKPEFEEDKVTWYRRERAYGNFSRTVELPFRIDPDKVQARFTNGILEVEMHRPEADKPKRIQITAS